MFSVFESFSTRFFHLTIQTQCIQLFEKQKKHIKALEESRQALKEDTIESEAECSKIKAQIAEYDKKLKNETSKLEKVNANMYRMIFINSTNLFP